MITAIDEPAYTADLQLSRIHINDTYLKEWNEGMRDFVVLSKDGKILNNNSLYRVGGLGSRNIGIDPYIMLLKYVEAYWDEKILKMSGTKDPKHLAGKWCIIDRNGVEKIIFDSYKTPYLVKNSCLYSLDGRYYNIETGYCYGYASGTALHSSEYVFIENAFDDDKSKRGVVKINKKTGEFELFS